jgi:hypothetical protein
MPGYHSLETAFMVFKLKFEIKPQLAGENKTDGFISSSGSVCPKIIHYAQKEFNANGSRDIY